VEKQPKKTPDQSVGAPPPMFGTLLSSQPKKVGGGLQSTLASLVLHALMIVGLVYATAKAASVPAKEDAPTLIQLAPQDAPPPPPPPPPLDVPPPVNAAEPVAKGFQTLAVPDIVPPDIPPPQVGVTIREEDFAARGVEGGKGDGVKEGGRVTNDLAAAPVFTPMTVQPKLLNGPEVEKQIAKVYPPLLRDAGIGGRTKVWFFIDENGKAVKWQVNTPSGYDALDAAALKVAPVLRFTPAQNQDKKVPVWVSIDIVFKVQ
jgi:protein TonB